MKIQLKNPLVFFDLETTGLNIITDRVIEFSYLKVFPDGHEESKTIRVNPEMAIDPKAMAIHGITNEDVKNSPTFKEIAQTVANVFEGSDFAGYNSNKFDLPLLAEEFLRAEIDFDLKKRKFIDVQVIFHKMEQRTLGAAYKFYCSKDLENAHSAEADTRATFEVLQSQLDRYPDLVNDVDKLSEFSAQTKNVDFAGRIVLNENGVETINFGKYKGVAVEEVFAKDPGYYGWVMTNEFPQYTKKVLTAIKLRGFNKKK
jgi:DNA polymerase III subunit epsilon